MSEQIKKGHCLVCKRERQLWIFNECNRCGVCNDCWIRILEETEGAGTAQDIVTRETLANAQSCCAVSDEPLCENCDKKQTIKYTHTQEKPFALFKTYWPEKYKLVIETTMKGGAFIKVAEIDLESHKDSVNPVLVALTWENKDKPDEHPEMKCKKYGYKRLMQIINRRRKNENDNDMKVKSK